MITTYQPEEIPLVWNEIEPLVEKGLARGSVFTKEDIYDGLRKCLLQLWAWEPREIEAILVTTIHEDACLLLLTAGKNMQDWKDHLPLIENWARSHHCKELLIQGRKGWSRLGFTITGKDELDLYIMRKEL